MVRARRAEPDWRRGEDYEILLQADRRAFAWEWLRRTSSYRESWQIHLTSGGTSAPDPRRFGLERFENPALDASIARPLWSARTDPGVVQVTPVDLFAAESDRLDLFRLASFVTLGIDEHGTEHVLLSDGLHSVRLDVIEGTLIGCPSSLRYRVEGAQSAIETLASIQRLIGLMARHRFTPALQPRSRRTQHWILELRVADALQCGATQQEIARVLYGQAVATSRWRAGATAYRRRVQRLVAGAKARLREPIDRQWFISLRR